MEELLAFARHVSPDVWAVIAVLAIAVVLIQAAANALGRWSRRRRAHTRAARASAGEARARALLEAHGYEVEGAQIATTYEIAVDDAAIAIALRADYFVSKEGKRYVAEVKTGDLAPRIDTATTRRQLLEYRIAFDVEGVLLVDVEASRVSRVTFPRVAIEPTRGGHGGMIVALLLLAAAIAIAIAAILHR